MDAIWGGFEILRLPSEFLVQFEINMAFYQRIEKLQIAKIEIFYSLKKYYWRAYYFKRAPKTYFLAQRNGFKSK